MTACCLHTYTISISSIGVSLSGEERTLACPGEPVHYTCTSPRVNSITWDLTCQDQQAPYTPSVNMEVNTTHHHLPCTSANGGMVSYDLTLTYESDDSTTESNISITVLEIADSVTRLNSLRISCESQDSYKYLDVTGNDKPESCISFNKHYNQHSYPTSDHHAQSYSHNTYVTCHINFLLPLTFHSHYRPTICSTQPAGGL